MKISLDWIKEYISPSMGAEQLAHRLTMAGLEVEAVHTVGKDKVFEIEVTPNRADCLSMLGVARELSAILNKPKKTPKIHNLKYPKNRARITITDKKGCRRYIGSHIEGISVTASPPWLKQRLNSVGIRSINNIVDITNFVLMETGQPLHAFDLDKLDGGIITVRRAKKGETITTIDDTVLKLDESVLVIADARKPVAIAGIMGGKDTEVGPKTKNILLESAYFDPVLIRRTSRKLGLSSDSSYRFERGVDIAGVKFGPDRAASLIKDLSGGKITRYADIKSLAKIKKIAIGISLDKINTYLGAEVKKTKIESIFKKLDFHVSVSGKKNFQVTAPTHRPDIKNDVDLIEEVARIEGYDNLPTSLPSVNLTGISTEPRKIIRSEIAKRLKAQSFNEIVTFSTTNQQTLDKARQGHLFSSCITNPLSSDQERMRPTMLPSVLKVISFNVNRGQKDLRFFETGKIYIKQDEMETLALAAVGRVHRDWRLRDNMQTNFYDIKGAVVNTLCDFVGEEEITFEPAQETALRAHGSAHAWLAGKEIGYIGQVDEDVLRDFDIKDMDVFFAQIDLERVYGNIKKDKGYNQISVYPPIVRDISLSFDKKIGYKKLVEVIKNAGSKNLVDIQFKEDYTDIIRDKLEKDHRGILISLVYQSEERTLQEDEVNQDHKRILDVLVENLNTVIR